MDFFDKEKTIESIMKAILGFTEKVSSLGQNKIISPYEFNSGIYHLIINIINTGVKPVAYTILAFICLLELTKSISRIDSGTGISSIQFPFSILIKFAIFKYVIDISDKVMLMFYELSEKIIKNISGIVGSSTITAKDLNYIREKLGDMSIGDLWIARIEVWIFGLILGGLILYINILIIVRMIELYVHMAIAPVPLATLPHDEYSQIGKNFIKSFCAICLKGVLIFIILAIFPSLFNAGSLNAINSVNFTDALFGTLGYAVILVFSIHLTTQWSKSIMNVM